MYVSGYIIKYEEFWLYSIWARDLGLPFSYIQYGDDYLAIDISEEDFQALTSAVRGGDKQ